MVGQKVAAAKSDRQPEQTYKDAAELLKVSDAIHTLLKQNTELTQEINLVIREVKKSDRKPRRSARISTASRSRT